MRPNPAILIIDCDRATRRLMRSLLQAHKYRVFETETGQTGIKEAANCSPDVIILELALPDMEGITVIERLREWFYAPILVLSERQGESDKVRALDIGANDYVTKPFNSGELLARLRVLQRAHPGQTEGPVFVRGNLRVDVIAGVVTVDGHAIDLTPTEAAIFHTLARHAGHVVTRRHLFRCVWGLECDSKRHDLHVYIASVRQKLREFSDEVFIYTEGSRGYCLIVPYPFTEDMPAARAVFTPS